MVPDRNPAVDRLSGPSFRSHDRRPSRWTMVPDRNPAVDRLSGPSFRSHDRRPSRWTFWKVRFAPVDRCKPPLVQLCFEVPVGSTVLNGRHSRAGADSHLDAAINIMRSRSVRPQRSLINSEGVIDLNGHGDDVPSLGTRLRHLLECCTRLYVFPHSPAHLTGR